MNIKRLTAAFTGLALFASAVTYKFPVQAIESGASVGMNESYIQIFTEDKEQSRDAQYDMPVVGAADLPSSYDLRDEGCVTSVKNQGAEGMCHAFAAIGVCESNLLKQGLETDCETLDLSEAQLGYFLYTLQENPLDSLYGDYLNTAGKGADGGNGIFAAAGLAACIGTEYEDFCSYSDWSKGYSAYSRYTGRYRLRSLDIIERAQTANTRNTIKSWLMESGAVGFAFYSQRSLYYDNGTSYAYYAENKSFYEDANHAALIVGWDDSYSRENFAEDSRPSGDGAWLVKNSYGADLFDDGYFWISYEDPAMGAFCRYIMESVENWDDVYEYDGVGYINSYTFDYAANVFTAEYDCRLTDISFSAPTANPSGTKYNVDIYTLNENTEDPTDGKLVAAVSGTIEHGGYVTADIEDEVTLKQGEQFSLVLSMSAPVGYKQYIYLPVEKDANISDTFFYECEARSGESYVYFDGGWKDTVKCTDELSELGNIPLKAFAVRTGSYEPVKLETAIAQAENSGVDSELLNEAVSYGRELIENGASAASCTKAADRIFAVLENNGADIAYPEYIFEDYGRTAGDSNGDGIIGLDDGAEVLSVYSVRGAGMIQRLTTAETYAMDLIQDGNIGLDDASGILKKYAEKSAGIE